MPKLLKETFEAWLDKQPGSPHSLHVKGQIQFPSGGWTFKVLKTYPQGFNPAILLLDVKVTEPAENATGNIATNLLTFDEEPAAHEYTQVEVRLGRSKVVVDVKIVH